MRVVIKIIKQSISSTVYIVSYTQSLFCPYVSFFQVSLLEQPGWKTIPTSTTSLLNIRLNVTGRSIVNHLPNVMTVNPHPKCYSSNHNTQMRVCSKQTYYAFLNYLFCTAHKHVNQSESREVWSIRWFSE